MHIGEKIFATNKDLDAGCLIYVPEDGHGGTFSLGAKEIGTNITLGFTKIAEMGICPYIAMHTPKKVLMLTLATEAALIISDIETGETNVHVLGQSKLNSESFEDVEIPKIFRDFIERAEKLESI